MDILLGIQKINKILKIFLKQQLKNPHLYLNKNEDLVFKSWFKVSINDYSLSLLTLIMLTTSVIFTFLFLNKVKEIFAL